MSKTVLLVDDAAIVRMMQKKLLEENGYVVVGEATCGAEAVEKHRSLKPDLCILDITMPGMDGLVVLKYLKSSNKDAKVVMCSSSWYLKDVVSALLNGALNFVTKPFQRDRFIYTIENALNSKHGFNDALLNSLADECNVYEDVRMSQDQISELLTYVSAQNAGVFDINEIFEKLGILYQETKTDETTLEKLIKNQEKIIHMLELILHKFD